MPAVPLLITPSTLNPVLVSSGVSRDQHGLGSATYERHLPCRLTVADLSFRTVWSLASRSKSRHLTGVSNYNAAFTVCLNSVNSTGSDRPIARLCPHKRSLTVRVFPLSPPYPHYTRIMETLGKLLSPLSMGTSAVQDTVVSTSVVLYSLYCRAAILIQFMCIYLKCIPPCLV